MRQLYALLLLAGCGRVGFSPRTFDAARDVAPSVDAFIDPIGCADGQREAFADRARYPTIAGCAATWAAPTSLRAPATGMPCGDDVGTCAAPADACSEGWHVCGDTGDPGELTSRITAADCDAAGGGSGSYVAALVHCQACINGCLMGGSECEYAATYDCRTDTSMYCAEATCCGSCGGTNMCKDGVFPGDTHTNTSVCGATDPTTQTGVLCCR